MMKRCGCCKETKGLDCFYMTSGRLSVYCKQCSRHKSNARYKKSKDKIRLYNARPDVVERLRKWKEDSPRHTLAIRLNAALKRRPNPDAITINGLMEKFEQQQGLCAVSGLPMVWRKGNTDPQSLSMDRINSELGYVPTNVRLVCLAVNYFKGQWSDDEMLKVALAIVANARKPKLRLIS